MWSSAPRSSKLNRYLTSILHGERVVENVSDFRRFLEAILDQKDPATCVERLVGNAPALKALQSGLRFNVTPEFINQTTVPFILYLSDPAVKHLCNGQFLRQLLTIIVEPRTLLNAMLDAFKARTLNQNATRALVWLVVEVLSFPGSNQIDVEADAQMLAGDGSLVSSSSSDIRALAQKVKHVLSIKASSLTLDSSGNAPGGRHDNDFIDFRKIAILPTSDEFRSGQKPFYRQATEISDLPPEKRIAAHLDNQFRLLREDMLSELRENLQISRGQKKGRRSAFVLRKLSVVTMSCGDDRKLKPCTLGVTCESGLEALDGLLPRKKLAFLRENRQYLKHQAFGCLLHNGTIIAFASLDRNIDDLSLDPPIVTLQISGSEALKRVLLYFKQHKDVEFLLVDSPIYAYEPILKCLQDTVDLPLTQELLLYQQGSPIPKPHLVPNWVGILLRDQNGENIQEVLETKNPINLDSSQLESLLSGLTQTVSLIQGPPGTGKSFIGALLAKAFHNYTQETILVMCYTNHALDQFLEDFLDIGIEPSAIVRLGSKSTMRTAPLSLSEQKIEFKRSNSSWDVVNRLKEEATELQSALYAAFAQYQRFAVDGRAVLEFLEFEDPVFFEALAVPEHEDGTQVVGKRGQVAIPDYLYDLWAKGQDAPSFVNTRSEESHSVWKMNLEERRGHINRWTRNLLDELVSNIQGLAQRFEQCHDRLEQVWNEKTRMILKSKRIIGCTTTAAAIYADDLRSIAPGIVLVEEAGEILESHIIAAMSPETKQMVLIGDHQQLRPRINGYNLAVEKGDGYDLNRSLFERLALGGYPHTVLSKQHRMCPEISELIRNLTYPDLQDDLKALNRPRPRGLQDRVIFFHHEHPELEFVQVSDRRDEGSRGSKRNEFEAEMVLKIVKYLGQQGYGTDQLVVLTPYLGQLHLLRNCLSKENDPVLNDLDSYDLVKAGLLSQASAQHNKRPIKLSSVDNFQGEESGVVIVSLTRSNEAGDIGFMASPQRLNVLLSRARDVLILVGNAKTFTASRKGKATWGPLIDHIKAKGHLYDGLPVKCEQHPHRKAILRTKEDFDTLCPDGGCSEPCGVKLSCGIHECPSRCHQLSDHSRMKCDKTVDRVCPRGHHVVIPCSNMTSGCGECNAEDLMKEVTRQRDLRLEEERERRQKAYARKLAAEVQSEIDASIAPRSNGHPCEASSTNGQERQTSSSHVQNKSTQPQSSSARADWEWQKVYQGAQSADIDSLMRMIGLEDVKRKVLAVKSQVDTAVRQNIDIKNERFGSVLVGNPGTGKTTVARLYARFLASVGVISGSFLVETNGSKISSDGAAGVQNILGDLLENGGGVLFIDEAYQMIQDPAYGNKPLNYLLSEVEKLTGKVVIILAGHQRQMDAFFAGNSGLSNLFPHELKFKDYDDNELLQILQCSINQKYQNRMKVEGGMGGLYCRIVAKRIGRGRGRDGFGNARAVESAQGRIAERQAARLERERRFQKGRVDDMMLTKEDLIGPEPSLVLDNCTAWKQLQTMIGLETIKKTVKALLDSIQYNYQRELEERPPVEFTLNRVFLGPPGSGKTSVAKLYGQILVDLGLLSNGEVVVKNPSDFIGGVLGESEKNTKSILASTVGKVLVIDEAYGLYAGSANPYRTAVIDTIVSEVQSTPGDDRCVLLLGYKDQMESMFQKVNPGLTRRFPVDQAFVFRDFTDNEMGQILDLKLKEQGFSISMRGRKVALEVLARARNRPHFGNAGEIDILLNSAKVRHQQRLSSTKALPLASTSTLEPQDFDEDFERGERVDMDITKLFEGVVGYNEIIARLEGYRSTAKNMKRLDLDPREQVPFNFLFRGPPGTGKTSTARKMGKVYYDMGLLASDEVVESSATEFIGQYVGQTAPKAQGILEKALGKVLFIDEAYRLADGLFAKEAMDEIVDCITKPKFHQKLIIILAGYDADINRLMSINPGLTSRFPESIQFNGLSPEECITLMTQLLQKEKCKLGKKTDFDTSVLESPRHEFIGNLQQRFDSLSRSPNWAHARDVGTLSKAIFGKAIQYGGQSGLSLNEDIILAELDSMLKERMHRSNSSSRAGPLFHSLQQAAFDVQAASDQGFNTGTSTKASARSNCEKQAQQQVWRSKVAEPRDVGVTDEVWDQLQRDAAAAKSRRREYDNLGTLIRKTRQAIDDLRDQERISTATVADAAQRNDVEAKKRHEQERLERELARRKKEADFDELQRKRSGLNKKRWTEQQTLKKLQEMGVCVEGYRWIKQLGGYRCAGGSHWVSDKELAS